MIPTMSANMHMPPNVVPNATARSPPLSTSACVPGSAAKSHDCQRPSPRSAPISMHPKAERTMRRKVTARSKSGLASLLAAK